MKKSILICLFLQLSLSAIASSRLTVEQLEHLVNSESERQDAKIASHLSELELTERLSAAKLTAIEKALPGPESRRALVLIADQATFLNPPAAEIPNLPAPGFQQQRAMIAKTVDYVTAMQHRLPNLFARRDTIHFEDTPPGLKLGTAFGFNPAQPLRPVSRSSVTVLYRDGQDFVRSAGKELSASTLETSGLTSFGEFGPILAIVLSDLPQGKLAWSHWEQGAAKPVAVFSFAVPKAASHYAIRFCCVGRLPFQKYSGYHGEITIEPESGSVLGLTLLADLTKEDPISRADLKVEYGPIELGGRTYFCPIRSVSLSLAADQSAFRGAKSYSFNGTARVAAGEDLSEVPRQTMLNETVFDRYHLFHSDARSLTGEIPEPASASTTDANPPAPPVESTTSNPSGQPPQASQNPASAASAVATVASTNEPAPVLPNSAAPAPVAKALAPPDRPEISVAAQPTPKVPTIPPTEASFSLRVTTRLVDIGLTAFDKKGRPITDLTREDFQVSDNGRKQSLRSFGHATGATAATPNSATAVLPAQYTNRIDAAESGQSAGRANAESTTIIFFDATSLKFDDLNLARQQVLKVLVTLPSSEPVGLYVRTDAGFRVLVEGTTDRNSVSSALRGWNPNARDVARAQEQEMRNRQQFDTLRTPTEVGFAYATVGGSGGGAGLSLDPKLMNLGEDPSREALTVLVAVAAHLGAIPGHKNLVWISSDNVLADWTDQSADGDAGRMSPNGIGTFSIRTQEALNNAHVSLYPFDASQLETDVTDASLQNAGVQLDASTKDQYPLFRTPPGGRSASQMRQQTHPVQIAMQELAQSTGGESFGRSSNVVANLNRVIEDGHAAYLLSFAPDTPPDDQYHRLTVRVPSRPGIELRYRMGYLYSKEPVSLKERFAQVLWQPFEATEIGLSAQWGLASTGAAVSLNIAAADISLTQQGSRRTGRLDIFLVQREDLGVRSLVSEQTLVLDLKPATYEKFLREGIPFDQYFDNKQNSGIVRIIVVDENSGRIGSITLPAATASTKP